MPEVQPSPPSRTMNRFGLALLLYVWILLILGGIALFFLQDYLSAYEGSQVKYCVQRYEDALQEAPPEAARRALEVLDARILSPEEREAWLRGRFSGASLAKDHVRSRDTEQIYTVKDAAGQVLGTVVLAPMARTRYNLPVWEVADEIYDYSALFRREEITVPSDYQVFLGSLPLESSCIVETQIPYADLAECYQAYPDLPTMVRYRTPPFVGDPVLHVFSEAGRELPPEELNEDAYLDRCSDEVRQRVRDFVPDFVELYVRYSANIDDSYLYYFFRLRALVRPESPLNSRLEQSLDGIGFSHTRRLTLKSVDLDRVTDLGQGRYLAELHYVTDITYRMGKATTEEQVQLVLMDVDGTLLADALYFR